MPRFDQAQTVEVALRRQPGMLLELTMQRAQRERKVIRQRFPADIFGKMIFQPGHQLVQARVVIFQPFHQAAAPQQHQQLHKQQLAGSNGVRLLSILALLHLAHQLTHLLQRGLIHPPVRGVVTVLLLRQQLIQPGEKLERIRRTIEHIGQAKVVGMFIQVPVVIAHEAHRTAADGIRLTVKHVDARSVLNNHNFMKIMMMLRERSLRQPWLNRDRRSPRRKKIDAVQYGHNGPHQ